MTLRRRSIRFDRRDVRALERLAKRETARVGSGVTASAIIRRLVKDYLRYASAEGKEE